jgi:uncharacterized protein (TIGR03118 family)
MAPASFGSLGGMLLVGNFGDGHIHAFDLSSCDATGCSGAIIAIDGLWAIDFGKGNDMTGEDDDLYFTAGPNDEENGLFGYIERNE